MHVRVRMLGQPESIVVVESKLTKIEQFRRLIRDKFGVEVKQQRLFYGGKLLEDSYTFHDYNIKLNDVIQLMVRIQPAEEQQSDNDESKTNSNSANENNADIEDSTSYIDADSLFYAKGDLIDMKDREHGAWFEGTIVRIVLDPKYESPNNITEKDTSNRNSDLEDSENKPPDTTSSKETNKTTPVKKKGIAEYFSKTPKHVNKKSDSKTKDCKLQEVGLLYLVQLEGEEEEKTLYNCKLQEIRPRARTVIDIDSLKVGQKVMINHNSEDHLEKGYWYDFKIDEIKKLRKGYELVGTLYLGPEAIPQNDTKARVVDKIYAIEEVVPLSDRTNEYNQMMRTPTEKRSSPLNCLTCRDDEDMPCKDCGCFLCSGKENPEKIILCDECNHGFHMHCLTPPLASLPEEDWYCPSCKRDANEVVAPGAAKQAKKANLSKSQRDWGRGMACVGKTKTSAMPANHFGPIPGIEVGMCWRFRIQLSESGVHRPPVSGIHGRDVEGAYSIVLSGGYEDDYDNGHEFTYTGSGGRDLSGNKRTAEQSCDQTLTRENKALARNCAVKQVSEAGADAGEAWRGGRPVRVVRSYKMIKHFPEYAPKEGIRYDGIYKVVKYYPETGKSGYRVWKYLLRRDDPHPAPWEEGAKQFSIVYPDGYLEAEALKKAQKGVAKPKATKGKGSKKRTLRESNRSSSSETEEPPPHKRAKKEAAAKKTSPEVKKRGRPSKNKSLSVSPKGKLPNIFASAKAATTEQKQSVKPEDVLSKDERQAIAADALNKKMWDECLGLLKNGSKKELVEHVTEVFLCIICQDVAAHPVTTHCLHNFCMGCIKLAFKSTGAQSCPCCRGDLSQRALRVNEPLQAALRAVMPGYDAGKKLQ